MLGAKSSSLLGVEGHKPGVGDWFSCSSEPAVPRAHCRGVHRGSLAGALAGPRGGNIEDAEEETVKERKRQPITGGAEKEAGAESGRTR